MKKFVKGMHKDAERVDMPEGTYRDALNANLYFTKGAIVNEQGNTVVGSYTGPGVFPIVNFIGQCALEDGRIVVFAIDSNPDTVKPATHIISIVDPRKNSYKVLYRNDELNFQPNYTIEATAKVDGGGNIKVTFTDNYIKKEVDGPTGIEYVSEYNPPRVFDVTRQETYIDSVSTSVLSQLKLYGTSGFNVDKLDIFMHSGSIPEFTTVDIQEGGGVVSGTYHLALAYKDDDGNSTNYLVTSNAVHIVTAPENTIPTEAISGDPQGSSSNKSITWNFTIPTLARNYTYVQPIVIQRFGGGQNQASSEFAYELDQVKIESGAAQSVTYSGLETVAQSSINEVVIDKVRYLTGKSIVQLDNRLYITNLKSRGDLGFQRFANAISLSAVTEEVKRFDPRYFDIITINKGYTSVISPSNTSNFSLTDTIEELYKPVQITEHASLNANEREQFSGLTRKGYKDTALSYKKKSYRRSEVYAFYISFVLKDGTETQAYHIPGRSAKSIGTLSEKTSFADVSDSDVFDVTGFHPGVVSDTYSEAKLFQFVDTHLLDGVNSSVSYWENADETYPTSDDFEIWDVVVGEGTAVNTGTTLQGENVRHHKMPSNKHKDYSFVTGIESWDSSTSNLHNQFDPSLEENLGSRHTLKMFETIRLLGVRLENLKIPKFILAQIQGYKVYYAKRNQKDKTIIGQSVPVPAALRGVGIPTMHTRKAKTGPYDRAWWMYGGIPPHEEHYLVVPSKTSAGKYNAFSVFGFHDFNLLRNKHTLSGASHVDVQSILGFRTYAGGPGVSYRDYPTSTDKTFPNTEWGPNATIGNNVDPNLTDPEETTTPSTDDINDSISSLAIKRWYTSVLLATAYQSPNSLWENANTQSAGNASYLNDKQTVFLLQASSATYLPGHVHLANADAGAFHGAKHLFNFGGESSAVLGLDTGLPALYGYFLSGSYAFNDGYLRWFPRLGWLNPVASDPISLRWTLTSASATTQGTGVYEREGNPLGYLINLCSYKQNVYDSYDEQKLVWTGHYKSLVGVDLETGTSADGRDNYYKGASSENIFGGDTYITRYGFRSTVLSYGHHWYNGLTENNNDIPFNLETGFTGNTQIWTDGILADYTAQEILGIETEDGNNNDLYTWKRGTNNPVATIFYFFCESDDLIGYRHSADSVAGVAEEKGRFFDGATANSVLFNSPVNDNTHMDNMLYMNNYSLNQDIRVTTPLPKKLNNVTSFPTRTIRSEKDAGGLNDQYRSFLALEYKDIPKGRGDIWDLFTLNGLLYIHTEKSIFATQGKETLQLGSTTEAFIGSGNIFAQDPQELVTAEAGYGGTDSQFASLTTRYGHFFVNRTSRRVFLFGGQLEEISSMGMEKWFTANIPYHLEEYYDINMEALSESLDAPTNYFGFISTYDAKFKRILLTKREVVPTTLFKTLLADNTISILNGVMAYTSSASEGVHGPLTFSNTDLFERKGWTVSYYPEYKVWGSRHSYVPTLYAHNNINFYSLTTKVWEHSDYYNPGNFYGTVYNYEFEYVDNSTPGLPKIFSSVYYWSEIQSLSTTNYGQTNKHISPGFTSFYVYNTHQISGTGETINYLTNSRLVDKTWYINNFRDVAVTTNLTGDLVTGQPTVQDTFITGVTGPTNTNTMFTEEGVVNPSYINNSTEWYNKKRFVDHYLGIRLICDNSNKNLVHLYAAGTKHRKSFR